MRCRRSISGDVMKWKEQRIKKRMREVREGERNDEGRSKHKLYLHVNCLTHERSKIKCTHSGCMNWLSLLFCVARHTVNTSPKLTKLCRRKIAACKLSYSYASNMTYSMHRDRYTSTLEGWKFAYSQQTDDNLLIP